MPLKYYILLSGILFGIGLGSVFYRRNIMAILLGIMTAGGGVILAMATIIAKKGTSLDGALFLITCLASQVLFLTIGCAVAYRRYISTGHTNIEQGNLLKN